MSFESQVFGVPKKELETISRVFVSSGGKGATNTNSRYWTLQSITGPAITYLSDTTLGDSFVINQTGWYSIVNCDSYTTNDLFAITKNETASDLASSFQGMSFLNVLAGAANGGSHFIGCCSAVAFLRPGDIIRGKANGATVDSSIFTPTFTIEKIG